MFLVYYYSIKVVNISKINKQLQRKRDVEREVISCFIPEQKILLLTGRNRKERELNHGNHETKKGRRYICSVLQGEKEESFPATSPYGYSSSREEEKQMAGR
ncbi:MAG: hypothetical protein LUE99_18350 [Bacteroides sp.]|nr:hypothetical protein [Bacteroides sp.]